MKFTEEQLKVIHQIDGPVITVACPGSGKTTTILERVNHMISSGINAGNILVVTFTKNAADEMNKRFQAKNPNAQVHFSTIHSLCLWILKWYYGSENYVILPEQEKYKHYAALLENKCERMDIENVTGYILSGISYVKNAMITPEAAEETGIVPSLPIGLSFTELFNEYETWKAGIGKKDFDDILIDCNNLFLTNKGVLEQWQDYYRYIIIDEFQDTNKIQASIFYMLADKYKNICVVGDDDQSIYGFRSADSSIMLNFKNTFPDAHEFFLSTNYRCDRKIVYAAENLISKNEVRFDKEFLVSSENEGIVKHKKFLNYEEQIASLIRMIESRHKLGVPYEDMAVLYRVNKTAIPLASAFKNGNIPFNIREKVEDIHKDIFFYDIKCYWRITNNKGTVNDYKTVLKHPARYLKNSDFADWLKEDMIPGDYRQMEDVFLKRNEEITESNIRAILKQNPPDRSKQIAKEHAACNRRTTQIVSLFTTLRSLEHKAPADFVRILFNVRYHEWLKDEYCTYFKRDTENVMLLFRQLKKEARNFDSMEEWFEYADHYDGYIKERVGAKDGVSVLTFHGSKGLEWSDVYIVEADKDVTPYSKATTQKELEEERRMFYVACTRAKHQLYIYSSEEESPFIQELKLNGLKGKEEKKEKPKAQVRKKKTA